MFYHRANHLPWSTNCIRHILPQQISRVNKYFWNLQFVIYKSKSSLKFRNENPPGLFSVLEHLPKYATPENM